MNNYGKFLIAEIKGDEITYYESGFIWPNLVLAIEPKHPDELRMIMSVATPMP
jgi:hypothetical protein